MWDGRDLMGEARPLYKVDADTRVARLHAALKKERQLRKEAEANAMRFHALLIKARVDLIQAKAQS